MAYDSFSRVNAADLNNPPSAVNPLASTLEQIAPNFTHKPTNDGDLINPKGGQAKSKNPVSSPNIPPVRKEEIINAQNIDKANQTMGKCYYSYIMGGEALNKENPFLR